MVSSWKKCLISSKESSLKDLQELAAQLFTKTKSASEGSQNATSGIDASRKKQQNREAHSNNNLGPLARFLISRLLEDIFTL